MSKSKETLKLEKSIYWATKKQGVFGCIEVTIGWFGKERVDYLTYDTKGIWRCYEIKTTLSDFRSTNNNTFVGHYNYYVMPKELFEKVKDGILDHVGVYVNGRSVKRAKKQELRVDDQVLKDSLIRSLYRDVEKIYKSKEPVLIESLERRFREAQREAVKYRKKYWEERQLRREGLDNANCNS